MHMTEVKIIYLTGKTGKKYRFYTFASPDSLKSKGGVYAITKRSKSDKSWEHEVMEIDQIHDMSELKAILAKPGFNCESGANCIAARMEENPVKRRKAAEDLWGNYFPSMLSA